MRRSDFALVTFMEDFNSGNTTATRSFRIDGQPVGGGYLLIQQFDVERLGHRILINESDLPGFDMAAMPPNAPDRVWLTWMDAIPPGLLRQGQNTITIRRNAQQTEFFRVATVAIHWREKG